MSNTQNRSTYEKKREVRANSCGDAHLHLHGQLGFQFPFQAKHAGDGIGGGSSEPTLYGKIFFDTDGYAGTRAERCQNLLCGAMARVRLVLGHSFSLAMHFNTGFNSCLNVHTIMDADSLVNRAQLMEAVRSQWPYAETDIDLGE